MNVNRQDIAQGLRNLGLKPGDIVMVHSSLSSMGRVEGGVDGVLDAFLDVLGSEGTLVVPAFGSLGAIPDTLKTRPGAVLSQHPLAAVAALGPDAEDLCRDHWKQDLAHGPDTPYTRLAEKGGFVCLVGVDLDRTTLLHTPEELLKLPYLRKTKTYTFDTPEGPASRSWPYFPGPHRDFIGLEPLLRENGKMQVGRIGNAVVRLIRAADLIEFGLEKGKRDPAFALCENPHCEGCVRQRADLRRARFAELPFTVAASACLAGAYPEEIVDNCRRAGIDAVELDGLKGRPLSMHNPRVIQRALRQLRAAQCRIVSLRLPVVCNQADVLFEMAVDNQVPRVVMPLSESAPDLARQAQACGLQISFSNLASGSRGSSDAMSALRRHYPHVGFAFSAAGFAVAGERPFLGSYRSGLSKFIDQLDVEDCLYDGSPCRLAEGNAEIKELLSILASRSFDGLAVLGPRNRAVGDLQAAAKRFEWVLSHGGCHAPLNDQQEGMNA